MLCVYFILFFVFVASCLIIIPSISTDFQLLLHKGEGSFVRFLGNRVVNWACYVFVIHVFYTDWCYLLRILYYNSIFFSNRHDGSQVLFHGLKAVVHNFFYKNISHSETFLIFSYCRF